ncbi:phosphoribosyltransferase family protein [Bradyrhizobium cenepequi]|uniref:phosphoribosyltransferase family protein n=1 Tax=Bradyrhizobium cenepequi TaxID=2821403 RepID=UPI0028A13BCD|nr:phosphoribosyltransferase family protein [Bradyrhizobium cenepequi]
MTSGPEQISDVSIGPHHLAGILGVPKGATAIVVFAHGSGSGRNSPRNNQVAAGLRAAGFATLLLDLLSEQEERDRSNVFDIGLLASRLAEATDWVHARPEFAMLPVGYFGASTGAAAALVAAAERQNVGAMVSRGGRPDLAGTALRAVTAPTQLIVGGADLPVIPLNRAAFDELSCEKNFVIVPRATHLFEEPGALEEVIEHARRWFRQFLSSPLPGTSDEWVFADRREAGRRLVTALAKFGNDNPVVLALPRGGVPVAFEVAQALNAPLDVVLVRKIGAPGHEELGLGAVVDGAKAQVVMNDEIVRAIEPGADYLKAETSRQLAEIERRRRLYRDSEPPVDIADRTVIVIDDGIATGGTMRAVLKALSRVGVRRLVLAVPVAPRDTLESLKAEADEIICLMTPESFFAVGMHYRDFNQTSDREVVELLRRAKGNGGRG